MGGFDDELRAVLRERAAGVALPVDPAPGIERRARRIRRRRIVTAGVGSVLAVGVIATGVPYAVNHLGGGDVREPAQIAAAAPTAGRPALTPLPPKPAPEISAAPDNQLDWPTQGYRPPEPVQNAVDTWYAERGAVERAGAAARRHVLWSGPLPESQWGILEQYWTPVADTRWTTVLFVGRRDGAGLTTEYHAVTTFNHQRPRESASMTTGEVDRIAGYGFGFTDFVLVVGGPPATQAAITLDGRHVRRQDLVAGAAVFEPADRGSVELFQLRDDRGQLLTPSDYEGGRYDSDRTAVQGWTLDHG